MILVDTLSIGVSIIGIFIGIITLVYYVYLQTKKTQDFYVQSKITPYFDIQTQKISDFLVIPNRNEAFKVILSKNPTKIDILGISLYGIFKGYDSELIEYLRDNPTTKVRILLLNPYSISYFKLAEQEKQKNQTKDIRQSYVREDILHSLKMLSKLNKKGIHIQVRLYNDLPSMMLFLSNNDCFIQPYASHELRKFKDYCVGILVQKIDKKTTALFDEMEKHFDNMWASSLTRDADLNEKASIELMKIQKMINEDKDDISDKVNKTTKLPN